MRMCVCSLVLRLFSLNSVGFGTFWGAVYTHRFQYQVSNFNFHFAIHFSSTNHFHISLKRHTLCFNISSSNKNTPRLSMYYLKSSRDYLNWTMSSLCCRLHDNVNNIQLYFISYDLHRMCIPAAHSMHVECIQLRLIFIILLVKANINKNTNNTRSQFESHHYRLFVVVFSFTKCSLDLNKISYVHGVHKRITNVKTCTFLSKIDIWMRKVKSCKTNGEKKKFKKSEFE